MGLWNGCSTFGFSHVNQRETKTWHSGVFKAGFYARVRHSVRLFLRPEARAPFFVLSKTRSSILSREEVLRRQLD